MRFPVLAALVLTTTLIGTNGARADDATVFLGWPDTGPAFQPLEEAPPTFLYDAATLPTGQLALGLGVGFPYVNVDVGYGINDEWDARVGIKGLYGAMAQVEASSRFRVAGGTRAAIAVRLNVEYVMKRSGDLPLLLSGARDFAAHPGVILSLRTAHHAAFFADLGVQFAFDVDPPAPPLTGAPPAIGLVVNLPLHLGMELPIGDGLNFITLVGLDIRLRSRQNTDESVALPFLAIGINLFG